MKNLFFAALLTLSTCATMPAYSQGHPGEWDGIDVGEILPPTADELNIYMVQDLGKPYVATITRYNGEDVGLITVTEFVFETPWGDVTVRSITTPNIDCAPACPDTLEVIDIPSGLSAIPPKVVIPEQGTGEIKLYPALLG
ncbi:hypothetical protein vBRpoSV10_158 [Ruegeria phage vB_RpoS-V10]|nr:hypothetical protein vBRpoSV10_158 [Ruegeria phage vB_RpoS-V10]